MKNCPKCGSDNLIIESFQKEICLNIISKCNDCKWGQTSIELISYNAKRDLRGQKL